MEDYQTDTDPNIKSNQEREIADETAFDLNLSEDLLKEICRELTTDDLKNLTFLVKPHLKDIQWRGTEDEDQFFKILEASINKIVFPLYVCELLFTIQRYDLLNQIGISKQKGKYLFEKKSLLDPLMKLLFNTLETLNTDDISNFTKELSQLLNLSKQSMDLRFLFAELTFNKNVRSSFLKKLYLKLRDENPIFADELKQFLKDEHMNIDSPVGTSSNSESSKSIHQVKNQLPANRSSLVTDDVYDMESSPCGICVIFNIEKFKNSQRDAKSLPDRVGTNFDRDNLKSVFESFDFVVEIHDNVTSIEIKLLLNELADRNHEDYSCFVCCFLSHGEDQSIFGADCKSVDIYSDIVYRFSGVKCKSLANKPKLFFIQACQGDKLMKPAILELEEHQFSRSNVPENRYPPSLVHFVLSLATVPQFQAVRYESGSLFISYLTKELSMNGDRRDILSILKAVNRKVANEDIISKKTNEIKKQMPYTSSTLTKELIFRKKKERNHIK